MSFVAVVEPSALETPAKVSIALAVKRPSGSDETSTRIASFPLAPITPLP